MQAHLAILNLSEIKNLIDPVVTFDLYFFPSGPHIAVLSETVLPAPSVLVSVLLSVSEEYEAHEKYW